METQRYGYDDAMKVADMIQSGLRDRGMESDDISDGVILGSGLGNFDNKSLGADRNGPSSPLVLPYNEIFESLELPQLRGGVKGHAKRLVVGPIDGGSGLVIAQSGREHLYEGVDPKRATFWLRVMQLLKVKTLIGSNAAGVVTPHTLSPKEVMIAMETIDDTGDNPLKGANDPRFGTRFPHRFDYYSKDANGLIKSVAERVGLALKEGVYIRKAGPEYETAGQVYLMREALEAMYRQGRLQKEDSQRFQGEPVGAVGMSSTYEALVARHAALSEQNPAFTEGVAYLTVATNYSASLGPDGFAPPSDHAEVTDNAGSIQDHVGDLVQESILEFQRKRAA